MANALKTAGETALEAIAREIDHGARGVNNCAYDAVKALSKAIRALGDGGAVLTLATEDVQDQALALYDRYLPTVADQDRYGDITRLRAYIERVDPTDPMEPFSDKDKWWPRDAMTGDEILEFYYSRHPEKRPKSEKRWPKTPDYVAMYALSSD